MAEYLFSYGTLLPENAPTEIAGVVSKLRPIGQGTAKGVLYDVGDYPGAVFDPNSAKNIVGTVFRVPDSIVWNQLDDYEGFDPSFPSTSLFIRRLYPIYLSSGRAIDCWVYEYNGERTGLPILTSGVYRPRHKATG
jgi:gamma-glutamylcyclotransferase (GGCT)/AIG2-like uncharacterized protein YtfP